MSQEEEGTGVRTLTDLRLERAGLLAEGYPAGQEISIGHPAGTCDHRDPLYGYPHGRMAETASGLRMWRCLHCGRLVCWCGPPRDGYPEGHALPEDHHPAVLPA